MQATSMARAQAFRNIWPTVLLLLAGMLHCVTVSARQLHSGGDTHSTAVRELYDTWHLCDQATTSDGVGSRHARSLLAPCSWKCRRRNGRYVNPADCYRCAVNNRLRQTAKTSMLQLQIEVQKTAIAVALATNTVGNLNAANQAVARNI